MEPTRPMESRDLGEQMSHSGAHICQIYRSETERRTALRDFLGNGLRLGERTYYIGEMPEQELAGEFLGYQGISFMEAKQSGAFISETSRDFYLKDGMFNPDRIFQQWRTLASESLAEGYPGVRIVGELLPEWAELGGCKTMILYETQVNAEFPSSAPARVICQYDARAYNALTILGVLQAHPLILVEGRVYDNPLYAPGPRERSH